MGSSDTSLALASGTETTPLWIFPNRDQTGWSGRGSGDVEVGGPPLSVLAAAAIRQRVTRVGVENSDHARDQGVRSKPGGRSGRPDQPAVQGRRVAPSSPTASET
jgi:hypothetical protein